MLKDYIIDKDGFFIFKGDYMEIYIPENYFERKIAVREGSNISTFGLLTLRVFKEDKPMDLEVLNAPTQIYLYPTETEKKEIQLVKEVPAKKYVIAKFYKDGKIMPSTIQQSSDNVAAMAYMIRDGNIDNNIPYDKLLPLWQENMALNNTGLNVSSTVLEIILAEICRSKVSDTNFAKVIGKKPDTSPYLYKPSTIRELCSKTSTFTALTYEDMDAMITTSLNMTNYNKKQTESPIEKIIKM